MRYILYFICYCALIVYPYPLFPFYPFLLCPFLSEQICADTVSYFT